MPFTQPFKFDFTDGDLIYGLAPMRRTLALHFAANSSATGPVTVDQYKKGMVDPAAFKTFLQQNEADKKYNRFAQAIRAHDNDEEKFASRSSDVQTNSVWRAKSKFGMSWTIDNRRGHIHFLLDQIDMAAVVTKTHSFANPQNPAEILARDRPQGKAPPSPSPVLVSDKERTITHSELRWLYRNRRRPEVAERVQFWHTTSQGCRPCLPPWDAQNLNTTVLNGQQTLWAVAWAHYVPTAEPQV
jgi:hypothetical protein